jgi:hypothetical protein
MPLNLWISSTAFKWADHKSKSYNLGFSAMSSGDEYQIAGLYKVRELWPNLLVALVVTVPTHKRALRSYNRFSP